VAILCCQAGMLSQYSFAPVRFEDRLRPPEGLTFAVAVSGVAAAKTGAAMRSYNRAAAVARAAVEAWNQAAVRRDPHLGAAMAGSPGAAGALRDVLGRARRRGFSPGELAGRAEQFEAECRLIPQAVEALRSGHYARLGELVDISQGLARRWLGNQAPQTIALAAQARELGALAASAFGAGFGGSVWALVESATAGRFLQSWRGRYAADFPAEARRAEFFTTLPSGPARRF
jgi:galactokinase